jgi:hypothetical protein
MPQRVVVAEHDTWRTPSDAFAATAVLQQGPSRLGCASDRSSVPTHPFPLTRSHLPVPTYPFPLTRSHSPVPLWLRRHFTLRRWGRPDSSLAPSQVCAECHKNLNACETLWIKDEKNKDTFCRRCGQDIGWKSWSSAEKARPLHQPASCCIVGVASVCIVGVHRERCLSPVA